MLKLRSARVASAAGLLLALCGACSVASVDAASVHEARPRESRDRDTRAILEVIDRFVVAFGKGDVATLNQLFWGDAVVYPSNDRDRIGWDDIRAYWEPPFSSVDIALRVEPQGLTRDGALAVVEMVTLASVRRKNGQGEPSAHKYRDMVVFRKGRDGRWRIFRNLSQAYPKQAEAAATSPASAIAIASAGGAAGASAANAMEGIERFLTEYVAAYESGSVDALRPFYTEGSLIWANQRAGVQGWDAVRAMFAPSYERFAIGARVDLLEWRSFGDTAYLRFLTEVTLTPKAGGERSVLAFRDFALLERVEGRWTIARNIDQPISPEQLQADRAREQILRSFE